MREHDWLCRAFNRQKRNIILIKEPLV
ncbi:hypothetical protein EFO86_16375 [Lactiplantibacillus plantarum]|nr:hypothetical protein [Lactiplantibacillus plantarum]MCT3220000.1 hypothetical protein [Lactiplantibacillus plantarum]MCT3236610.1 hypothetical protein [Lactiplantibacillus plantarum]MCT3266115.1 hypothetical protein [Lactiplantibacillus plantarum]